MVATYRLYLGMDGVELINEYNDAFYTVPMPCPFVKSMCIYADMRIFHEYH